MNGVTGRMGTNQHLIRSLVAIISQLVLPIAISVMMRLSLPMASAPPMHLKMKFYGLAKTM